MFAVYFAGSALALMATFGLDIPDEIRLYLYFLSGSLSSAFSAASFFTYPNCSPPACEPRALAFATTWGGWLLPPDPSWSAPWLPPGPEPRGYSQCTVCGGFCPLIGLLFIPWVLETRGQTLPS